MVTKLSETYENAFEHISLIFFGFFIDFSSSQAQFWLEKEKMTSLAMFIKTEELDFKRL